MYGMSIKFKIIKSLNRYKWVLFMIVDILEVLNSFIFTSGQYLIVLSSGSEHSV